MKTLVYGGSFDPPHRGHAKLLAAAARAIRPDRILVIPAWHARFKNAAPAASAQERGPLAEIGLVDALPPLWRRVARVDRSELRAGRMVTTVETLTRLKKARPRDELHFVCGQDTARSFPRWRGAKKLAALAVWWCGARPGEKGPVPAHFRRLPGRFPDVSSTELRRALALGRPAPMLLPGVRARIERRGIYGVSLLRRLRRTLKPSRFEHTLNVAELAETLAERHGVDPQKARTAGLLHDMGRRFRPDQLAAYVRRRGIKAPRRETLLRREPMLLHAYVSADLASREFKVSDPAILAAVSRHTLGGGRMAPLDKVLYVADACSADRSYPGVAALRKRALRDLDGALRRCAEAKIAHARERGAWVHPATLSLWNSLRRR